MEVLKFVFLAAAQSEFVFWWKVQNEFKQKAAENI